MPSLVHLLVQRLIRQHRKIAGSVLLHSASFTGEYKHHCDDLETRFGGFFIPENPAKYMIYATQTLLCRIFSDLTYTNFLQKNVLM